MGAEKETRFPGAIHGMPVRFLRYDPWYVM